MKWTRWDHQQSFHFIDFPLVFNEIAKYPRGFNFIVFLKVFNEIELSLETNFIGGFHRHFIYVIFIYVIFIYVIVMDEWNGDAQVIHFIDFLRVFNEMEQCQFHWIPKVFQWNGEVYPSINFITGRGQCQLHICNWIDVIVLYFQWISLPCDTIHTVNVIGRCNWVEWICSSCPISLFY